jgi:hypothetical protein
MKELLIFFVLFLSLQIVFADMDWTSLVMRAADTVQTQAIDLLEDELYSLQYDEHRTVSDFLQSHPDRAQKLPALLREYRTMSQHYLTDGSVEYVYQLLLKGNILSLLLPDTHAVTLTVPMLCPCCGQEWPAGRPIPDTFELVPKQIDSTAYTGIIIDCHDVGCRPCLFPKIYNETLEEVYSINFADLQYVIEEGLVLYTEDDVDDNPRIGSNPLRIHAIGTVGEQPTNIIISSPDAERLHGSVNNLNLIKECRVVILGGL